MRYLLMITLLSLTACPPIDAPDGGVQVPRQTDAGKPVSARRYLMLVKPDGGITPIKLNATRYTKDDAGKTHDLLQELADLAQEACESGNETACVTARAALERKRRAIQLGQHNE